MTRQEGGVERRGEAGPLRLVFVSLALTTAVTTPAFMLGALAVQVRADLDFSEAQLGGLVTAFFAASAASSTPGGRLVERIGTRRGLVVSALISATALGSIALIGRSWALLVLCVLVGGVANGVGQPATNLLLAGGIAEGRRGLAFGVKQAAVPAASLLGGLAVPAFALTVGWRWAFAAAVLLPLAAAVLTPRTGAAAGRRASGAKPDSPTSLLVLVAAVTGLGTAAATAIAAFLVEWSVLSGIEPGVAGLVLAASSGLGVTCRVLTGWWSDLTGINLFRLVGALLALGVVGCGLLVTGAPGWLVLGGLLGIGMGWGWNGLLVYGVVRLNPSAPAAATGVTQTGLYLGGMTGPASFGLVVERWGYEPAWVAVAVVMAVAALLAWQVPRAARRAG